MLRVLIRNWGLLAFRGVLALAFAALALGLQPLSASFLTRPIVHAGIVVIFGFLALLAGGSTIVAATRGSGQDRFHLLLWDGIGICLGGVIVLLVPWLNLVELVHLVAVWAMVVGAVEFITAMHLRRHLSDEWSLALAGAASFFLGVYFLYTRPEHEAALFRWLALYAALSGLTILALALRLRRLGRASHQLVEGAGS